MRKVINVILVILVFVLAYCDLFSQDPIYKNYSVDQGLPSSECYQVLQDKKGYIWVVTDKGLSRYNGLKFENYTKENGLPENCVVRISEDEIGRIWIATLTGQIAYYYKGEIKKLSINKKISQLIGSGGINSLEYYNKKLYVFTHQAGRFLKINLKDILHPKLDVYSDLKVSQYAFMQLPNNKTLQGTLVNHFENNQFNLKVKLKNKSERIFKLKYLEKKTQNVRSVLIKNRILLFAVGDEVLVIDLIHYKVLDVVKIPDVVYYLYADKMYRIWILTAKGICRYSDFRLKSHQKFYQNFKTTGIIEDRDGVVWLTTLNSGLLKVSFPDFLHIKSKYSSNYTCLSDFKEKIYVGSDEGNLFKVESDFHLKNIINNESAYKSLSKIESLSSNELFCIGNSYVGVYNIKSHLLKYISLTGKLVLGGMRDAIKINDNWILLGCKLLLYFDKRLINYDIVKFQGYDFRCIENGSKNEILLGSNFGLFSFDENKKLKPIFGNSSVLKNRINDIEKFKKNIFIATNEDGVVIQRNSIDYVINSNDGLSSNSCKHIFVELENKIWVTTSKGVDFIEILSWAPLKFKIKSFSKRNGLLTDENNAVLKKLDTVYVASKKGITCFKYSEKSEKVQFPKVEIEKIKINKKQVSNKLGSIFPHNRNNFSFEFTCLSFKGNDKCIFRYHLKGLSDSWVKSSFTKVNYQSLPYGDYKFEVLAQNNDGVWSKTPATYSFSIMPPFWHTWWFRIVIGLGLITLIYSYFKYRIRQIEKREAEKLELFKKAAEMEMKFLGAQMNPHFTFNAMNSIQYYLLDNEPEKASKYLVKYARLIRMVLENNMKNFISINDEIEMLHLYMEIESLRFEIPFSFSITVDEVIEKEYLKIPPMILQPFIENAIWHGLLHKKNGQGKIDIHFYKVDEKIKCTIEDNGVGRKKAKELNKEIIKKKSLGMVITQQRLERLHSDIGLKIETKIEDLFDENGLPSGTKIEIFLPTLFEKED